jgi:predicted aspartyl protease
VEPHLSGGRVPQAPATPPDLQETGFMTKRRIACAAVLLAFAAQAQTGVPLSVSPDTHYTVPAYINGHGPYPFILDTGADQSAIYPWLVEQLGLKPAPGPKAALGGATGTAQVPMYDLDSVELDGHRLGKTQAYGMPARHDQGREGGALGNDLMDGAVVVYDYPCRRVELHAKPTDIKALVGGDVAPTELHGVPDDSLLNLPITVNGVTGIGVIDTGMRVSKISHAFAAAAGIDEHAPTFHDGDPIYGANAKREVPRSGPIGTVSFAGVTIPHATAQVLDLASLHADFGDRPAFQIGTDLLDRYRLVYDHQGRRLWLLPSRCRG